MAAIAEENFVTAGSRQQDSGSILSRLLRDQMGREYRWVCVGLIEMEDHFGKKFHYVRAHLEVG